MSVNFGSEWFCSLGGEKEVETVDPVKLKWESGRLKYTEMVELLFVSLFQI